MTKPPDKSYIVLLKCFLKKNASGNLFTTQRELVE